MAGREVIIIPPFMYKSIQFPKVSQRTFKTKGLISIEGTFFGTPCSTQKQDTNCNPTFNIGAWEGGEGEGIEVCENNRYLGRLSQDS